MRTSVVIVTKDEGRDLEATVALCGASEPRPYEIIVVDDHCHTSVQSRMGSFPYVQVVKPPIQLGAGPAKQFGVEHTTGDIIVILDSHMRVPYYWLELVEEACKIFPMSAFCPTCRGFDLRKGMIGAGAEYIRRTEEPGDFFLMRNWCKRGKLDEIDRVPCLLGACYIFPRRVWEGIGGFNPNLIGWGMGEQDLSMRLWLLGYEVRRINLLTVAHHFGRNLPPSQRMNSWHRDYNMIVVAATLFEDGVFEELYEPFMQELLKRRAWDEFESRLPQVIKYKEEFRSRVLVHEGRLNALCGYRHPTVEEQRRAVDAIVRNHANQRRQISKVVTYNPWSLEPKQRRAVLNALPPNGRMLEWGVGDTTKWFRERLLPEQELVSIEHDPEWALKFPGTVLHEVETVGYAGPGTVHESVKGIDGIYLGQDLPYIRAVDDGQKFDVILVDGVLRNACLIRAAELLKPGGRVFLHDAQRRVYMAGMKGFDWERRIKAEYKGSEAHLDEGKLRQ